MKTQTHTHGDEHAHQHTCSNNSAQISKTNMAEWSRYWQSYTSTPSKHPCHTIRSCTCTSCDREEHPSNSKCHFLFTCCTSPHKCTCYWHFSNLLGGTFTTVLFLQIRCMLQISNSTFKCLHRIKLTPITTLTHTHTQTASYEDEVWEIEVKVGFYSNCA